MPVRFRCVYGAARLDVQLRPLHEEKVSHASSTKHAKMGGARDTCGSQDDAVNRSDKATHATIFLGPIILIIERAPKLGHVRAAPRRWMISRQFRGHVEPDVGRGLAAKFVQPQPQRPITMKPPLLVDAPHGPEAEVVQR